MIIMLVEVFGDTFDDCDALTGHMLKPITAHSLGSVCVVLVSFMSFKREVEFDEPALSSYEEMLSSWDGSEFWGPSGKMWGRTADRDIWNCAVSLARSCARDNRPFTGVVASALKQKDERYKVDLVKRRINCIAPSNSSSNQSTLQRTATAAFKRVKSMRTAPSIN